MLTQSDSIKSSKSSSETDSRRKKRIKKLIQKQYTHGIGESGRSHLVEDGGESAAGRFNGRRHLLQRDRLRRDWRAAASRHGLPHLQQKRGRFVVQYHRVCHFEFDYYYKWLNWKETRSMKTPHENPKGQRQKAIKGSETQIKMKSKLKRKTKYLKNNQKNARNPSKRTKITNQSNKNQKNFRQNSAKRNSNRLSTLEKESQRKGKLTQKR
jgi:hypothetical protein